jgi:hypothetical protein
VICISPSSPASTYAANTKSSSRNGCPVYHTLFSNTSNRAKFQNSPRTRLNRLLVLKEKASRYSSNSILVQFTVHASRSVDVSHKAIVIEGVKNGCVKFFWGSHSIRDLVRGDFVVRSSIISDQGSIFLHKDITNGLILALNLHLA